MSKPLIVSVATVGAAILTYACFMIFAPSLPEPQANSAVVGGLILAGFVVVVWGFTEWAVRKIVNGVRHIVCPVDPSVVEIGERISRRLADND